MKTAGLWEGKSSFSILDLNEDNISRVLLHHKSPGQIYCQATPTQDVETCLEYSIPHLHRRGDFVRRPRPGTSSAPRHLHSDLRMARIPSPRRSVEKE